MTFDADDVVAALSDAGVRVDRPLTEADVKRIEKKYGFTFGAFHRSLLRTGLPVGDAWLNWRHATPAMVKQRLDVPGEIAGAEWDRVPRLVPLYGTRYLAAHPSDGPGPVFSVEQGAVRVFARDLLDYVDREFGHETAPVAGDLAHVPFWSDLAG